MPQSPSHGRSANKELYASASPRTLIDSLPSEERYRAVVEQTGDGIFLIDGATKSILEANSRFEELLGYGHGELHGMSLYDLVPHDREGARANVDRVLEQKSYQVGERSYRRKDGSLLETEVSASLIEHDDREILCCVARDITERKRVEERLRESEERHRAVVEQSMEGIYLFDPENGRVLESNGAFEELLGYTSDELLGLTIYDFIVHEREDIDRQVNRSLKEKRRHKGERKYRHKDGSSLEVEASAMVIPYCDGEAVCCVVHDVTERKGSEEKLRKSEASLAEAQRIAHLGNWEYDLNTGEVLWSDETCRIYGHEPEEFVPTFEKLMDVVHPDDRDLVRQNLDGALFEGEPYDFEHRIVRPSGEERVVHRQAHLYLDEEGQPQRMVGTVHDITEQKRAEKALRGSEERYRQLVDLSPEMVAVHSDGKWLYINDAGARLLGASDSEELIGKPVMDFVHPEYREIVRSRHSQLERGESNTFLEQKLVRLDGQFLDVEVASAPLSYQGKPANQSLVRDITERKKTEEALRESEERFRSAFENSPIGVALVDLDGQRFRVNRALCEMLGYSEEELLCAYLEHVHPDDRDTSSEHLRRLLEEGTGNYTLERRYLHADGHVVWNLTSVSLIRDSRGEPSHLVCLHQDITERKELEERLEHQAFYDSLIELPNRALFSRVSQ